MFYTGLIQGKCPINVNWYCYNPHNVVILLSKWGNCATVFVRNQVASCWLLGSKFESRKRLERWFFFDVCEKRYCEGLLELYEPICALKPPK